MSDLCIFRKLEEGAAMYEMTIEYVTYLGSMMTGRRDKMTRQRKEGRKPWVVDFERRVEMMLLVKKKKTLEAYFFLKCSCQLIHISR